MAKKNSSQDLSDEALEEFRPTNEIRQFAQILKPEDAEPPVLSGPIRQAVRQWLVELNSGDALKKYNLIPRRSAMLSGPPGCGKTTLAHHFAARLGLPLLVVNMASIIDKYIGSTGRNVNALFDAVDEQHKSCLLFLDEFDSIATKRTSAERGIDQERNSIIISLLQKIDEFRGTLIVATNRGDDIDPAIWRRFGMHLEITEPDSDARFAILKRYLMPMKLPDKAMDLLSEVTAGATPAVLRQLMEGIKRDLILSPLYEQKTDSLSVFNRLVTSIKPHAETTLPALWKEDWALESVAKMSWPPSDDWKEDKAA